MELPRRFGYQIKLLSTAFEQASNRSCELSGLTGTQTFLVNYVVIHRDQPIYAKTLEREFHLKHPTVCGMLQRLEAKGFITLATDTADRRCRRIVPTQKAIDTHMQAIRRLDQVEQQLIRGFSDAEAAQFYQFLSRAAANVGIAYADKAPDRQEEQL